MRKVAIIGGSVDAVELAQFLHNHGVAYCLFETDTYVAGTKLTTQSYPENWHNALVGFTAVVSAPHPFASLDPTTFGIEHALTFRRPAWIAAEGDNWQFATDQHEAANLLTKSRTQNPLLAIGRERLAPFLALDTPQLIVRCRKKPLPDLQGRGRVSFQSGPFSEFQEIDFMVKNRIDLIVAHNAGGQGGWPKLAAARALALPVILIDRPIHANTAEVSSLSQAVDWLRQTAGVDVPALSD